MQARHLGPLSEVIGFNKLFAFAAASLANVSMRCGRDARATARAAAEMFDE
jgi:hypothetical protein